MRIGRLAGGTGTLLVSGAGAHVGVARSLRVGDGTLTVSAGGQLGSSTGIVGDLDGQVGSLTVRGPTSAWTITGSIPPGDSRNLFMVGRSGTGTLDVVGGGQLVVDSGPNLGPAGSIRRFAGSVGTINVYGVGSRLEIKGRSDTTVADPTSPGRTMGSGFNVGDQGQGTLNITAGGKVIKIDPGFQPAAGMSLNVVQVRSTPQGAAQSLLTVQVPPGGGGATPLGPLSALPTTASTE